GRNRLTGLKALDHVAQGPAFARRRLPAGDLGGGGPRVPLGGEPLAALEGGRPENAHALCPAPVDLPPPRAPPPGLPPPPLPPARRPRTGEPPQPPPPPAYHTPAACGAGTPSASTRWAAATPAPGSSG